MPLTKVSAGVIAANAVNDSFGTQSITGDKIGLGAITGNTLASNIINANNIVGGTITTTQIASNTISNTNIQTGAVENYMRANNLDFGFRNRIINGQMTIDQRNAGAAVTPASFSYTLDRWGAVAIQASKFSVQQDSSANTVAGFTSSLKVTSLSSYSVTSTDTFNVYQSIEGFNCADFAWGTASARPVTLSFWVRSSLTGTFGGAIKDGSSTNAYPFTYTISAANTWEQKIITIPGPTSGQFSYTSTTNGQGLQIQFGLGAGSTYSGTAGAWAAFNAYSATGATSVVGTNGATWYITGVQLEEGSSATSFEYRHFGMELALCQRYFESTVGLGEAAASGTAASFRTALGTYASSQYFGPVVYKVNKRSIPTVTFYNENNTSGALTAYSTSTAASQTATTQNSSTTGCNGTFTSVTGYTFAQGKWSADAEL